MSLAVISGRALGRASVALFAVAASAQGPQRAHELRYTERAGERVEVAWSASHELAVQRLVTQIGAREPSELAVRFLARGHETLTFVDEALRLAADGPDDFRREYLAGAADLEMREPSAPADAAPLSRVEFVSELADASVRHQRAADGAWGRHYDRREAREALLANVRGPLAWGALLPAAPVALGAEWSVAPEALAVLLAPTGELGWSAPGEQADPQLVRSFLQGLGGNLGAGFDGAVTGTVTGQLFAVEVVGADQQAVLRFTFEVTLTADNTALARRRALDLERDQGVQVEEATAVHRLRGTADVRWRLQGGRPLGARVTADEEVALSILVRPEAGEAARQTVEFKGACSFELTTRVLAAASTPVQRDAK